MAIQECQIVAEKSQTPAHGPQHDAIDVFWNLVTCHTYLIWNVLVGDIDI